MSSLKLFFTAILTILSLGLSISFSSIKDVFNFFKTKEGLGVLKGIVLFILFGVLLAIVSSVNATELSREGVEAPSAPTTSVKPRSVRRRPPLCRWFAFGKAYLGLDYTKKQSPQCDAGGPNDHLTSNGGLLINICQSADRRFEFNARYTHHSCAFSPDAKSYDAGGLEAVWFIW